MVKRKDAASEAVRQVERSLAEIRKRSKKLLKRANLDVKEYRKQLSTLKKQGLVSKRINAARHHPTRYMLKKIKTFKDVAVGRELAFPIAKLSPHRARQYVEKGIAQRIGKFITVPRTAVKQKADVYKGHIEITTQLNKGEERVIHMPAYLEDMHDVLEWLAENEDKVNELKGSKGQLGFQLQGHNSRVGLANVKELISYLQRYDGSDPRLRGNIFNGHSKQVRAEFVIIRFRPGKGKEPTPQMEPYFGVKRYSKGRGKKDRKDARRGEERRRENERLRKARQRMAEDKEQHERRLERQRQRDRARANDRREKRMHDKLMGK